MLHAGLGLSRKKVDAGGRFGSGMSASAQADRNVEIVLWKHFGSARRPQRGLASTSTATDRLEQSSSSCSAHMASGIATNGL